MDVLLEHTSEHRLGAEEKLVAQYMRSSGHEFRIASLSQVDRNRVDARSVSLVVGSIPFIAAALRQRGIKLQSEDTYPDALMHLLKRRVWRSTLRRCQDSIEAGSRPFFIKPALRAKRFTGFVLEDFMDYRLQGVSRSEPVWCSEVVTWVSEWRVYVVDGRLCKLLCRGSVQYARPRCRSGCNQGPRGYA